MLGIGKGVEGLKEMDYNADWYLGLTMERKKAVFMEALYKCPYLSHHMKLHQVKASDKDFVNHYCFRMMLDVLRGN